jgi:hypothetical protein
MSMTARFIRNHAMTLAAPPGFVRHSTAPR